MNVFWQAETIHNMPEILGVNWNKCGNALGLASAMNMGTWNISDETQASEACKLYDTCLP